MSPGRRIIGASWLATAAFAVTAVTATLISAVELPALVVALGLSAIGIVAFLAAFARAVPRSRPWRGCGALGMASSLRARPAVPPVALEPSPPAPPASRGPVGAGREPRPLVRCRTHGSRAPAGASPELGRSWLSRPPS